MHFEVLGTVDVPFAQVSFNYLAASQIIIFQLIIFLIGVTHFPKKRGECYPSLLFPHSSRGKSVTPEHSSRGRSAITDHSSRGRSAITDHSSRGKCATPAKGVDIYGLPKIKVNFFKPSMTLKKNTLILYLNNEIVCLTPFL